MLRSTANTALRIVGIIILVHSYALGDEIDGMKIIADRYATHIQIVNSLGYVIARAIKIDYFKKNAYVEKVNDISFGDPLYWPPLANPVSASFRLINCSDALVSRDTTLSLAVTRGETVTKTDHFSNSQSISSTARFSLKFEYAGFDQSDTVSSQHSYDLTNSSSSSSVVNESISDRIGVREIPPHHYADVSISTVILNQRLPWTASVIFNSYILHPSIAPSDRRPASDLMPEWQRTITIKGFTDIFHYLKAKEYIGPFQPINSDSPECAGSSVAQPMQALPAENFNADTVLQNNSESGVSMSKDKLKLLSLTSDVIDRAAKEASRVYIISGEIGQICYIAPCDRPLNGTRDVCKTECAAENSDGDCVSTSCTDCGSESDGQCEPDSGGEN